MHEFDYLVIGNGLFGSAAIRYLSEFSQDVAVIGPEEPKNQATHRGVFSSHYDQRRLTQLTDHSKLWVDVTRLAINGYRDLEARSGIKFYEPIGLLIVGGGHLDKNDIAAPLTFVKEHAIDHTFYPAGDRSWRYQFSAYDFSDSASVLFEHSPAGMIDPRAMRRAQLHIAKKQGAEAFHETVVEIKETADHVDVQTLNGDSYRAQKVLISAGSFCNFFDLLPKKLALQPETETVVLAEVSPADAQQLKDLPTLSYAIEDDQISDFYMTPPVQYEDGRYYFKMGANTVRDQRPNTLEEVQTWFRQGDSDSCLASMQNAVRSILPTVQFLSFQSKRCILTRTPSRYPMVDQLTDRLFIAAGANGSGAKSADTFGKLAAGLVHDNRWLNDIPREPFKAVYR